VLFIVKNHGAIFKDGSIKEMENEQWDLIAEDGKQTVLPVGLLLIIHPLLSR